MPLMPDPKVARFFSVCQKTIDRWSDDPELNFPPRIDIMVADTQTPGSSTRSWRASKASVVGERAGRRKLKAPPERAKRRKQDQEQSAPEAA